MRLPDQRHHYTEIAGWLTNDKCKILRNSNVGNDVYRMAETTHPDEAAPAFPSLRFAHSGVKE